MAVKMLLFMRSIWGVRKMKMIVRRYNLLVLLVKR